MPVYFILPYPLPQGCESVLSSDYPLIPFLNRLHNLKDSDDFVSKANSVSITAIPAGLYNTKSLNILKTIANLKLPDDI